MRSFLSLLPLSGFLIPVQSLYFYIEGTTPKCFYEELPKDTMVVGHYSAEEFNTDHNAYVKSDWLNIFISVDVRFFSLNRQPLSWSFDANILL
jgi:p24 family protein alpha